MDEKKELLELILGIRIKNGMKSTLQLALQSARHYCGYTIGVPFSRKEFDLRQGGTQLNDEGDMFAAILLYLIALEQLGTLFYDAKHGIDKVLESSFCSKEEKEAISHLRHCLAHSYGLAIRSESRKTCYLYCIDFHDSTSILSVTYEESKNIYNSTVFAIPFSLFVEQHIEKNKKEYIDGKLNCNMELEILKARYTLNV